MTAYGWTGKFLRVDLTEGYCAADDTLRYADYIGGRGIAARISWEDITPDATAFDPGNVLTFFGGPLTGTTAPFSGRTEVCGLAPQGWPVEWFTRAGMGGHWSPELKYAGWDGLAIKGESDHPVYLLIEDEKVSIWTHVTSGAKASTRRSRFFSRSTAPTPASPASARRARAFRASRLSRPRPNRRRGRVASAP
jgi:aldehyde:ferredoxin oxidoreductase